MMTNSRVTVAMIVLAVGTAACSGRSSSDPATVSTTRRVGTESGVIADCIGGYHNPSGRRDVCVPDSSVKRRVTVTGVLEAVGGPAPGSPRPLSGTIYLRSESQSTVNAPAGRAGRFSVSLLAGSYTVTGRSSEYEGGHAGCPGPRLVVVYNRPVPPVEVSCQEK